MPLTILFVFCLNKGNCSCQFLHYNIACEFVVENIFFETTFFWGGKKELFHSTMSSQLKKNTIVSSNFSFDNKHLYFNSP